MGANPFKLLFVDDDALVVQAVQMILPANWKLTHTLSLKGIKVSDFDAAFVDMHLTPQTPDKKGPEGLGIIKELHSLNPHLEIVAFSGDLDRDIMEASLQNGASRFLAKPLAAEEFKLTLEKIEALILLQSAVQRSKTGVQSWIGTSSKSQEVKRQIASLQNEPGPILIEGESGTGKEVAAGLIHGPLSEKPFIPVNIAAIPENLFESEMFGHVRGAFTGADQNKMGLAEAANGGDLFIDEIEALPLNLQPILLRFLESGEIRRVGAKEAFRVQARVIVASNQNLSQMVQEGKFRDDLLWRLNGKKISLPPLRDRKEDIIPLAKFFLSAERPRRNKTLGADAEAALSQYDFPGNVRELKRICEQLSLYSPLPIIRGEDVAACLPQLVKVRRSDPIDLSRGLTDILNGYEADVIRHAIQSYPDIDQLAQVLKVSRSNLYKKLKDHSIELPG